MSYNSTWPTCSFGPSYKNQFSCLPWPENFQICSLTWRTLVLFYVSAPSFSWGHGPAGHIWSSIVPSTKQKPKYAVVMFLACSSVYVREDRFWVNMGKVVGSQGKGKEEGGGSRATGIQVRVTFTGAQQQGGFSRVNWKRKGLEKAF